MNAVQRRHIVSVFFYFMAFVCVAQNNKVKSTGQMWSEVDLGSRMKGKWKWQLDIQYSRQSAYEKADLFRYNSQLTIRPWVHFYPKNNVRISGFMGLWYSYAIPLIGARKYPEYRGAMQSVFYYFSRHNILMNRLRAELREMKDPEGVFETVVRGRYMFKYRRLLRHEDYDKNSIYLIGFDEFFVNGGSVVTGYKFFDQNRVFLGLGYNLTDDIAVETGYFNQLQHHAHDFNFDLNHNWQISLIIDHI